MTQDTKVKKLYLSSNDKIITGLCGGIAEYFRVDVSLVRLAWIVVTIITGLLPGVLAYLVGSLFVPPSTENSKETTHDTYQ